MDTDDEQEITAAVVDNNVTDSDKLLNGHMDIMARFFSKQSGNRY